MSDSGRKTGKVLTLHFTFGRNKSLFPTALKALLSAGPLPGKRGGGGGRGKGRGRGKRRREGEGKGKMREQRRRKRQG